MSFDNDKKLKFDNLDKVSGGMYNVTSEQALSYAKSLGGDLGESYLNKFLELRIDKIKKEFEVVKSKYNESQKSVDNKSE